MNNVIVWAISPKIEPFCHTKSPKRKHKIVRVSISLHSKRLRRLLVRVVCVCGNKKKFGCFLWLYLFFLIALNELDRALAVVVFWTYDRTCSADTLFYCPIHPYPHFKIEYFLPIHALTYSKNVYCIKFFNCKRYDCYLVVMQTVCVKFLIWTELIRMCKTHGDDTE